MVLARATVEEEAEESLGETAPIAHINMQLYCICRKCATPSTHTWLWLFIYSTVSRHFGHVYDTCDFWATATATETANWLLNEEDVGCGKVATMCGTGQTTYRFMW